MYHFIINAKNYEEASGENALLLAQAVRKASASRKVREKGIALSLAVPAFSISELSKKFPEITILAQHLDPSEAGSTTGHLVPQIAKLCGAKGTLLNHSERRIPPPEIRESVRALRNLNLRSIVCAQDSKEVKEFTRFEPDIVAIEPPELIGSGNAVSKVRPDLITGSDSALKSSLKKGQKTILLCGAGIVDEIDVKKAIELGARGILVASSVIKSDNWLGKIESLANGFGKEGTSFLDTEARKD